MYILTASLSKSVSAQLSVYRGKDSVYSVIISFADAIGTD